MTKLEELKAAWDAAYAALEAYAAAKAAVSDAYAAAEVAYDAYMDELKKTKETL